jgi:ketosteroid isomerase-like protein
VRRGESLGPFRPLAPNADSAQYCGAMSHENVDFVRGLLSGGARLGKEELLAALPELVQHACDPEIEWIEDPSRADARTYRGHEGVIASWRQWLENFDEYGGELEEVRDCGDSVLATMREEGRGRASGATVSARNYIVMTFRDGKILRYQEFYDEAATLEAAGGS